MEKNRIKTISHNSLNLNFTYDGKGRLKSVSEGNMTLLNRSVTYDSSGKTESQTVGNTTETIKYNKYDKPKSVTVGIAESRINYNGTNSNAKINKIEDNLAGNVITYTTDDFNQDVFSSTGRLVWNKKSYMKDGKIFKGYNINNGMAEIIYSQNQFSRSGKTVYQTNMMPNYQTEGLTVTCNSQVDNLNRLVYQSCSSPNGVFAHRSCLTKNYTYKKSGEKTYNLITKETTAYTPENNAKPAINNYREYEYNAAGSITKIKTNKGNVTYEYTGGRLTHEVNELTEQTINYSYDIYGNVTRKQIIGQNSSDHVFSYYANCPTLLQTHSVDGIIKENISYTNGLPTSHNGTGITWERGLLKTCQKTETTSGLVAITEKQHKYTYTYDIFGNRVHRQTHRTIKTNNTVTSSSVYQNRYYYYDEGKLVAERTVSADGTEESVFHYIYDDTGICAFKLHRYDITADSAIYPVDTHGFMFFNLEKDIFGNVVGIYSNNELVLQIDYDAFGVPYYNKNLLNSNLKSENYFRFGYKGYYYDQESDLYFTGKEYYNPVTGRYLAPQSIDNISFEQDGLNLFAYCHNRPLNADQIQIKAPQLSNFGTETQLTAHEALAQSIKLFKDMSNYSSNTASFLHGICVYRYLKHIHGNPPKVSWFFDTLDDFKPFSKRFGIVSAIFAGIDKFITTGNILAGFASGLITFGASYTAAHIGMLTGGAIGGIPGMIIGTILAIGIEWILTQLFNVFADIVFGWLFGTA
jgi:RHS repeat-associated protein